MVTIGVLMLVLGGLWLAAAVVGVVFKLAFAVVGGVLGVVFGALGLLLGAAMLVFTVPLMALALLPALLPLLILGGAIWLIARASRRPSPAVAAPPR